MTGLASWTPLSFVIGGATLITAGFLHLFVRTQPSGNASMGRASAAITSGTRQLLLEAGKLLAWASFPLLLLLAWQGSPSVSLAFAWGILLAVACCSQAYFGIAPSGLRVAQGAREVGERWALSLSLMSGSAALLGAAGIAALGVGVLWFGQGTGSAPSLLVGFSLAVSLVALLVRAGGGVYARSAGVATDLLARVQGNPSEPEAPQGAQAARDVGELSSTGIGIPLEALECFAGAAAAAVLLGGTSGGIPSSLRVGAMAFPVATVAAASLASLGGAACALGAHRLPSIRSMRLTVLVGPLLFLLAAFALGKGYALPFRYFASVAIGFGGALVVGAATRRYASGRGVIRIAGASQLGSAQNVISGFALGLEATAIPTLVVAAGLLVASLLGGSYGVGLAALGATAAAALALPFSVAGTIGGQAMRIAEASRLGPSSCATARAVELEGDGLATVGAGVRTAASAFGSLAWIAVYVGAAGRGAIDLGHPSAVVGILLGAAIPFFVCSSALMGVGDVALEIVGAVRRREAKGADGEPTREHSSPAVAAGPRKLIVPGLLALVTPIAVGFGVGSEALGGLLAGATGSGILLCLFLLNGGDGWRGTLRHIEEGAMGGRGSDAHRAAAVGDALGEPLKDAGVPTVWGVLRVLAAASVIVSPLLP